jgi:hypothetical protein
MPQKYSEIRHAKTCHPFTSIFGIRNLATHARSTQLCLCLLHNGCASAWCPLSHWPNLCAALALVQAEEPLYLKSGQLVNFLRSWQGSAPTLLGRFEELVIQLYERMYVELEVRVATIFCNGLACVRG